MGRVLRHGGLMSGIAAGVATFALSFFGVRLGRAGQAPPRASAASDQADIDSDPTPNRRRIPVEPTPRRRQASDLPPREKARQHARSLLDHLLETEAFEPGLAIEAGEMYWEYRHLCDRLGWDVRPWNPVATELNKLLGGKTYHRRLDDDGEERPTRVYVIPPLDHPLRLAPEPVRQPRVATAKRLQAGGKPTQPLARAA
jgi:hypothetical protein